MNFLEKMVVKAVAKKVDNAAMSGVLNHVEKTRSVDALVNKSTSRYKLFMKKKSFSLKRGFIVCDEQNNKKYIVKTDMLTFGHPCMRLYDMVENEIGKVELSSKAAMGTYSIYLDGEKIGNITRKMSLKIKFDLDFNEWKLEGNLMQNSFVVYDKEQNTIMKLNSAFAAQDTYVIEMNNRENEIMGLLLVMAIEIALYENN